MKFHIVAGMFILAVACLAASNGDTIWTLMLLLFAAAEGVIIVFDLTDNL